MSKLAVEPLEDEPSGRTSIGGIMNVVPEPSVGPARKSAGSGAGSSTIASAVPIGLTWTRTRAPSAAPIVTDPSGATGPSIDGGELAACARTSRLDTSRRLKRADAPWRQAP